MTTSSVGSLAQDLQGILSSFGSMLEGVYHVDEELAGEIAEKFTDEGNAKFAEYCNRLDLR